MKTNSKEKSKSKSKIISKRNNNEKSKNNTNPYFIPIKYLCLNEVKKIVNNNKNKKSPVINKNNEKPKVSKRKEIIKIEEEDEYDKSIYNKRLIIFHNISLKNIIHSNYSLSKIEENNHFLKYWNSIDERYKVINKYGINTKKIFKAIKRNRENINYRKSISKFSKKNYKKLKNKSKTKFSNQHNYIDIHDITNIINNNSYFNRNVNESNSNTITSNTITSKTITNNTMSNYTISNATPNSFYNKPNNTNNNTNPNLAQNLSNKKENKERKSSNKINNIKIISNKGRNKSNNMNRSLKIKNDKNKEYDNTVFVRRIILEEKFTIDSKGDKKTIYIKKISPIIETNEVMNSADKRLIKKKKLIKNNYHNRKDSTFISHNDINLNFNVCSFQKINVNNNNMNKKNLIKKKMQSFDGDYKSIFNNETSINDSILKNYKDFLKNKKYYNKIIYQKPNAIIYNSENNQRSFKSLFSSPNKGYLVKLTGNDVEKKMLKNNPKKSGFNKNNKNNKYFIEKKLTKDFKSSNTPLKYIHSQPRCLKNKLVHRKTKTNVNNLEYEQFINYNSEEDEENNSFANKRSLSFVAKTTVYNLVKKMKESKRLELKDKFQNSNNSPGSSISTKNPVDKINEGYRFSPFNSVISSKNATKMNSINSSKNVKKMSEKKNNVYNNINKRKNNNSRSHSLNKIGSKNNYNSKEMKSFVNYLKKNKISGCGRNKSHRNFMINNRCENYTLGNILNKNRKKDLNSKKANYSNLIYMKNKAKEKILKNKQN